MKLLVLLTSVLLPAAAQESDDLRAVKPRASVGDETPYVSGNSEGLKQNLTSSRIVGGTAINSPTRYPWMVQGYDGCGGSLIASDIVLTAAHCEGYFDKGLLIGAFQEGSTYGGAVWRNQTIQVKHPSYNSSKSVWDFMVIKLDSPVTNKQPIEFNRDPNNPNTTSLLTVIGFGATSENGGGANNLMGVTLDYIDYDICNSVFRNIDDTAQLCAGFMKGGRDACYGDNGGPLMDENNKLVGVLSFGIGCARRGIPGVYSRVSGAIRWIEYQVCSLSSNPPSFCWAEAASSPTSSPAPSISLEENKELVEIEVDHDLYPEETSWTLQDSAGNIIVQQAAGSVSQASAIVSKQVYLQPGTYNFTIMDSNGDGMCCAYGSGSFRIKVGGITVVVDDGEFETYETKSFTVSASDQSNDEVKDNNNAHVNIKESPVSIEIDFQYDMFPQETTWYVREQGSSSDIFRKEGVTQPNAKLNETLDDMQMGKNYELTILDSQGDGFCCGKYGDGVIKIYAIVGGKTKLLQEVSGEFESKKVIVFSVPESQVLPGSTSIVELEGAVEQSIEEVRQARFPNNNEGNHDCEDTNGTFFVDRVLGDQNCEWLAVATERFKHLCEFVDVVIACPKTCDSCDLFV